MRLGSWWDTSGVKVEKRGDVSPWPHGERAGISATDDNFDDVCLSPWRTLCDDFGLDDFQLAPIRAEGLKRETRLHVNLHDKALTQP